MTDGRSQLMKTLNKLVPQQFNQLLFVIKPPPGIVRPEAAPQSDRVCDLLTWAESPTGFGLEKVKQALKEMANSFEQVELKQVELKSEKNVNYANLDNLLARGKWKEADLETGEVMCQAAGRTGEGWLRIEDIDNFSCEDLRTIDQLWLHYSKGKFGFSIQQEIYERLGGTGEYDRKIWENFGARVGWIKEGNWLNYCDLTFNLDAPQGHLPCGAGPAVSRGSGWVRDFIRAKHLFPRVRDCNIKSG